MAYLSDIHPQFPCARNRIRFRVAPGRRASEKAARRLCFTQAQFLDRLPQLLSRGFPAADRRE
jgi:hypothetical protein